MKYTNDQLLNLFNTVAAKRPFLLAENTLKTYNIHLTYFFEKFDKNIFDITKRDVKDYMLSLKTSDSTYNVALSAIRCLYKVLAYTLDDESISDVTFGLVLIGKVEKQHKTPLTPAEQTLMLKYAKNSRDYAFILMMVSTGLRIHEVIALTLKDYLERDENGKIELTVTKGNTGGAIWLNSEVCTAIDNYLLERKESEYDNLFINNACKPLERTCCSRMLKITGKRAGLDEERIKKLNNHSLRATFGTNLSNSDVKIEVVAKLMRHHSIQTSYDSYIKIDDSRLIEAVSA